MFMNLKNCDFMTFISYNVRMTLLTASGSVIVNYAQWRRKLYDGYGFFKIEN